MLFFPTLGFGLKGFIRDLTESNLSLNSSNPLTCISVYLESSNEQKIFPVGFRAVDGGRVQIEDQFRIASETKMFVSTIILQLMEEGKLSLDEPAFKFLASNSDIRWREISFFHGNFLAHKITLEQLLTHRSGLADIFSDKADEFVLTLIQNPDKQYSPESIFGMYHEFDLPAETKGRPGKTWYYSDMNYVILGMIIEEIESKSLAECIRERILDPLQMSNTFFEFYEAPVLSENRIHQYFGEWDMTLINTSFDWAGGGIVSNHTDMATFISALFKGSLLQPESLDLMTEMRYTSKYDNPYGLGICETVYQNDTFYGHYGYYGTFIGYCPAEDQILSYCINQVEAEKVMQELYWLLAEMRN